MEDRIRNFVYNNDHNYTSYGSVKCLMICVCWFITLIAGTYAIIAKLWLFMAIFIVINCAFLLHLILLKFFFKNNYALRFLSDGIVNMLLSSLFLPSAYTILCATDCDTDFVKYGTLISYVMFIILHVVLMLCHSKFDKYQHTNQSLETKRTSLFIGSLIPISGTIGMIVARIIFGAFDFKNQVAVYVVFVAFTIVSLLFSLGYVNFVKYYYCKKYRIICDENGDTMSSNLEPKKKDKKKKTRKQVLKGKEMNIFFKILLILIGISVSIFAILFIIEFIKVIIESI